MTEFWIVAPVMFAAGATAMFFGKDGLMKMVIGANALSAKLHAKADKIKAGL